MKGKVALVILIVIAAAGLWLLSTKVAESAGDNDSFLALYEAAKAAKEGRPVYSQTPAAAETEKPAPQQPAVSRETPPTGPGGRPELPRVRELSAEERSERIERVRGEREAEAAAAAEDAAREAEAAERAAEEAESRKEPATVKAEVRFGYLPYVAMMVVPLAFFKTASSAAVALFWFNVALVIIVMLLSMYVLAGKVAGTGLFFIPLLAAAPILLAFLPSASLSLLALVFVLIGLCLYRNKQDILAGVISAIAVFSPLGIAIGAYWFLKRSWPAVIGFIVAAGLLIAVLPMATLGPSGALSELKGFRHETIRPYLRMDAETATYQSFENQSLWAVMLRHTTFLSRIGEYAGDRVKSAFSVDVTKWTRDYMGAVAIVIGAIFLLASVLGAWRRLLERNMPIVGLEGALVVLATLVLSYGTTIDSMAPILLPLTAAVYAAANTDLRRISHHVNYIVVILAGASFYLSLDPPFRALGVACGGMVALWVGILAAIYRFRPHLVRGTLSEALKRRQAEIEKPIDLVDVRSDTERREKKGEGVLPLPEFTQHEVAGRAMTPREEREVPDLKTISLEPGEEQGEETQRGEKSGEEPEETDSAF